MYALMTMLAAGIEAGAGALSKKVGSARRRRVMHQAAPVTDAAPGRLREITGRAVAGSGGPLIAPLSGESCVWYAVTVLERYQAWRPGPLGPTKVERQVRVAQRISGPLHVVGDTASVRVDARGADFDLGEPVFTEFEQSANGPLVGRLTPILGARLRARHRERTLGFLVEEVVIRADDEVYVAGQARTELGDLVITKPTMRPFIVSRMSVAPVSGGQD